MYQQAVCPKINMAAAVGGVCIIAESIYRYRTSAIDDQFIESLLVYIASPSKEQDAQKMLAKSWLDIIDF